MEVIKYDKILSVNSETPNHEAKNLLERELGRDKSWLAEKGTEKAVMIMKLERAAVLSKVDVGNAHSAFIELLVGRASDSSDQFQTLIPTSTYMSPNESKSGQNKNQVRFFTTSDFEPNAVGKQWDLIKVVCSQPFDKHVPYGLCFLTVHGEAKPAGFSLKPAQEENIAVGSFFKRWKDSKEDDGKTMSISEKIRDAEKPEALAKHTPLSVGRLSTKMEEKHSTTPKSKQKASGSERPDNRKNRDIGLEDESSPKRSKVDEDNDDDEGKRQKEMDRKKEEDRKKRKEEEERKKRKEEEERKKRKEEEERKRRKEEEERRKRKDEEKKRKRLEEDAKNKKASSSKKHMKPFEKLMEDVVFVLSGYQNPERGEYRSHALAMGARYSQDWKDGYCTHLIAAYINTPKCNQVRGKGKIVNKDWIEKCYNDRKRYPWRRFALDKSQKNQPESEDEIDAGTPQNVTDADEPSTSARSSPERSQTSNFSQQDKQEEDAYNVPTDDEDDEETSKMPSLPGYFRGQSFYVDDAIADRSILERYIIAYDGIICEKMNEDVNYYITMARGQVLKLVKDKYKKVQAVSPTWVQSVNCSQRFIPSTNFIVE